MIQLVETKKEDTTYARLWLELEGREKSVDTSKRKTRIGKSRVSGDRGHP